MAGVRATRQLGLDPEQEAIERQMMQAEALRQGGMSSDIGQGYQGGKVFIVGNPLGRVAQSIGGAYMNSRAGDEQRALTAGRDAQLAEFLRSKPSATQDYQPVGPMPDGSSMPVVQQNKPYERQARELQDWAGKGAIIRNPLAQAIAQFGIQHSLAMPEKAAEREDVQEHRRFTLQQTLAAQQQRDRERAADRAETERQRALDRQENIRLTASLRQAPVTPADQLVTSDKGIFRLDRSGNLVPLADKDGNPLMKPATGAAGDRVSATERKARAEANLGVAGIDDAIAELSKPEAKGALGLVNAAVPEEIRQYTNPEGVVSRAAVANIGSLKLHDRSGAAVTASEFPRLKPFIPKSTDKPEAAIAKLNKMRDEYVRMQKEWGAVPKDAPGDGGGKTITREVQLKDGRTGVEYSDGTRGFK